MSKVNGEHFIADAMSSTREFARGDKKNEF